MSCFILFDCCQSYVCVCVCVDGCLRGVFKFILIPHLLFPVLVVTLVTVDIFIVNFNARNSLKAISEKSSDG